MHREKPKATCLSSLVRTARVSVAVWRSGSMLVSINKVNLCWARLVFGWVTDCVRNVQFPVQDIYLSMRSTQPGHPFMGKRNEYQPKDGDVLRLGSKGRYGLCMGGR